MPAVAVSISLPIEVWAITRELGINRSAIARKAIEAEIQRVLEENADAPAAKQEASTATPRPVILNSDGDVHG